MKKVSAGLLLFVLIAIVWAANNPGIIDGSPSVPPQSEVQNLRSVADWGDCDDMDISDSAGNITVATNPFFAHPTNTNLTPLLKGIYNNTDAAVAVVFTLASGRSLTLNIPASGWSGKLPLVATLTKAGTSDGLVFFWQYQ